MNLMFRGKPNNDNKNNQASKQPTSSSYPLECTPTPEWQPIPFSYDFRIVQKYHAKILKFNGLMVPPPPSGPLSFYARGLKN